MNFENIAIFPPDYYKFLKVPRNPSTLAFICTQIGLIHDIF